MRIFDVKSCKREQRGQSAAVLVHPLVHVVEFILSLGKRHDDDMPKSFLIGRKAEERKELPRAPQARRVGIAQQHQHPLARHQVDRQVHQPVGDILLVNADFVQKEGRCAAVLCFEVIAKLYQRVVSRISIGAGTGLRIGAQRWMGLETEEHVRQAAGR